MPAIESMNIKEVGGVLDLSLRRNPERMAQGLFNKILEEDKTPELETLLVTLFNKEDKANNLNAIFEEQVPLAKTDKPAHIKLKVEVEESFLVTGATNGRLGYHRTHSVYRDSILTTGLRVNSLIRPTTRRDKAIYGLKPIYLAMTPDTWILGDILLKVDCSKIIKKGADINMLMLDYSGEVDLTNHNIHWRKEVPWPLEKYANNNSIPLEYLLTWSHPACQAAIRFTKTFVCMQDIPASCITEIPCEQTRVFYTVPPSLEPTPASVRRWESMA
jgi:hypothetical protein